jgi:hypothetical protein
MKLQFPCFRDGMRHISMVCMQHTGHQGSSDMYCSLCLTVLPQESRRFLEHPLKHATLCSVRGTDASFHIVQSAKFRSWKAGLYSYFFHSAASISGTYSSLLNGYHFLLKNCFLFWLFEIRNY